MVLVIFNDQMSVPVLNRKPNFLSIQLSPDLHTDWVINMMAVKNSRRILWRASAKNYDRVFKSPYWIDKIE